MHFLSLIILAVLLAIIFHDDAKPLLLVAAVAGAGAWLLVLAGSASGLFAALGG